MNKPKKKNRRRLWWIIGGGMLLLVVIAVVKGQAGSGDKIAVTTKKVKRSTITETVDASGKIQPELEVKISADVSGELIELSVKEGDKVAKGQVLARINPDLVQSSVNRAEAAVNSARANLANSKARLAQVKATFVSTEASYNRNKKLYDEGAISTAEWETAIAQYEGGKADVIAAEETVNANHYSVLSSVASLKEAQDNLGRTTLVSPIDGTVSKLLKEEGERVVGTAQMEGTTIMHIANLTVMEADVEVNENDIVRVSLGDTAYIEVDAYQNRKFKGIVTEIANSANNSGSNIDQVTNFPVKIRLLQSDYQDLVEPDKAHLSPFRPGMSANVEIHTETVVDALVVPIEAVTTREDTSARKKGGGKWRELVDGESSDDDEAEEDEEPLECVFVLREKTVHLVAVETGVQDTRHIHVKSGLEEGWEIVVGPFNAVSQKLYNRDKVTVESSSSDEEPRFGPPS